MGTVHLMDSEVSIYLWGPSDGLSLHFSFPRLASCLAPLSMNMQSRRRVKLSQRFAQELFTVKSYCCYLAPQDSVFSHAKAN